MGGGGAHVGDVAVAHAVLEGGQLDHPPVEAVVGGRLTEHDLRRLYEDGRNLPCATCTATLGDLQGSGIRHLHPNLPTIYIPYIHLLIWGPRRKQLMYETRRPESLTWELQDLNVL